MAHVVGADHDNDDFRSEADELAMGEAPEDMFRAVTAESEIGRFEWGEVLLPSRLPFPPLGDGIAQKHDCVAVLRGETGGVFGGLRPSG